MRIGITTFGADAGRSGIGKYLISLLKALSRMEAGHEFEVFVRDREEPVFLAECPGMGRKKFPRWPMNPILDILSHQLGLAYHSRRSRHDVLFLPAGNRRVPLWSPCPTVGAVHDLSSFHVEGKYDAGRMFYIKQILPKMVQRLSKVITMSESSKRDIMRFTDVPEERISVIYQAHDADRFHPRDGAESRRLVEERFGIRGPYILYASRLEHPGKNHVRLIGAFARLKQRGGIPHSLVLAGADWNGAEIIRATAASSPVADRILFPGYVPDAMLPQLYAGADLFVFPSLYEGFGIPILEAMASGIPVACSDVSSMPEVGGDAVAYFDPMDEEGIESTLRRILEEPGRRQELRVEGLRRSRRFDWAVTARETMRVLQQASRPEVLN